MQKGKISLQELESLIDKMEEHNLSEVAIEIDTWSDTGLLCLTAVDAKGEWL